MSNNRLLGLLVAIILASCVWQPREAHATACTAVCSQYVRGTAFSGHTVSVALTGITAGDAIHVYACGSITGTFAPAVTDAGGATFTVGQITITTSKTCFTASAPNAAAGNHTLTVDYGASATCSNCEGVGAELSGEVTTSLQDNWQASTPSGQNALYVSNSVAANCALTTSNANDRVDYALFTENSVAPASAPGWTLGIQVNSWYVYYQTLAVSGSQTLVVNTGATAYANDNTCMANKLASGVGGPPLGSLGLMGVGR